MSQGPDSYDIAIIGAGSTGLCGHCQPGWEGKL